MKTYKEFLNEAQSVILEAKETFSDFDKWKAAVLAKSPKASFTKEGAGGSEFVVAAVKGSPQQAGKWMGPESQKKGTGYTY